MHWGIVSKHNFSSLEKIPRKRWDPLVLSPIVLDEFGHKIVLSKSYGHYSYISPVRPARQMPFSAVSPLQVDKSRSVETLEVFKPIVEGRHIYSEVEPEKKIGDAHAIVVCNSTEQIDDPFSVEPKVYKNLHGDAITMINKFPAMVRCVDEELVDYIEKNMPLNAKMARGVNLLTIPTQFYRRLEDMPVSVLADIFQSQISGITAVKEAANARGIKLIPTSPFFNIGKKTAGHLQRLHAQVYMDLNEDGHSSRMESILKAFEKMKEDSNCNLCHSTHDNGKRLVYQNDSWVFFASGSPVRNYHLRFTTHEHIEDVIELSRQQLEDLASALNVIFTVMNELKVNTNRNIIIYTKPFGHTNAYFHVFGEILPHEDIGGAELADDFRVVRISPLDVARELRLQIRETFGEQPSAPETENSLL
jgi:UDPglucose--hexose-1-phosphate uridylyltransferase